MKDVDIFNFVLFINQTFTSLNVLDVGTNNCNLSYILKKEGYNVDAMDHFTLDEIKTYNKFNINCINDYFDINTNLDKYDLVIGFHVCKATELIIRNCAKNNKEFAVVLCELNQGIDNNNIKSRKDYINYLLSLGNNLKYDILPRYKDEHSSWKEIIYYKK